MTANQQPSLFEEIKKSDDSGNEFWSARDLAKILEYTEYRHFKSAIERAKEACKNSEQSVSDHFEDMLDMVQLGSGAVRKLESVRLSRYACYRENITGKQKANKIHFEVGVKVRQTIEELGGTMPENLPVADNIKKLAKPDNSKQLKTLKPKK